MSETDPPRIRDERRDSELIRIKERLSKGEKKMDEHEKRLDDHSNALTGVNHTLYGIPQDHTNNGIVGSLAEVKSSLRSANAKLMGILIAFIVGIISETVVQIVVHNGH
jgi:hypothetical protein